jgi:endoglucanase
MLRIGRFARPVACVIACAIALLAPDVSSARGSCVDTSPGVAATRTSALARGFNLAGQLDGAAAPLMHPDMLRALRRKGMSHIRLPVPAESIMSRFSSDAATARQLRNTERVLTDILALGYAVTVDLHPGDDFQKLHRTDENAAMAALEQAWGSLTTLIGRFPSERVFAELLNEPDIDAARWQIEVERLAAFVRKKLPDTTLIIGPVNWQRADSLPGLQPLDDLNVVYAIHFYDPMAFTHQGHWNESDPLSGIKGLPFPIRRDDAAVGRLRARLLAEHNEQALKELETAVATSDAGDIVARQLEPALQWQRRTRRPIIVNEFGVLKHHAPRASRIAWLGSVAQFAEANCWGWTHWEFAQGFGLLPRPAIHRGECGAIGGMDCACDRGCAGDHRKVSGFASPTRADSSRFCARHSCARACGRLRGRPRIPEPMTSAPSVAVTLCLL